MLKQVRETILVEEQENGSRNIPRRRHFNQLLAGARTRNRKRQEKKQKRAKKKKGKGKKKKIANKGKEKKEPDDAIDTFELFGDGISGILDDVATVSDEPKTTKKTTEATKKQRVCDKCQKTFKNGHALGGHKKYCNREDWGSPEILTEYIDDIFEDDGDDHKTIPVLESEDDGGDDYKTVVV